MSIFGLLFFFLRSILGIARQWSHEKFAILSLTPRRLLPCNLPFVVKCRAILPRPRIINEMVGVEPGLGPGLDFHMKDQDGNALPLV